MAYSHKDYDVWCFIVDSCKDFAEHNDWKEATDVYLTPGQTAAVGRFLRDQGFTFTDKIMGMRAHINAEAFKLERIATE